MKAMIFAAGLGTRLFPLTEDKPKALIEVGGKTLLQRAIESIMPLNPEEIIINVHHFASLIKAYLEINQNFGAPIYISDESDSLLDTGGGLAQVKSRLLNTDYILAVNVDVVTNMDYQGMISWHQQHNALATLAVRNRKSSRYFLFDEQNCLSGWKNVKSSQQIVVCERYDLKSLAFSGMQVISPQLFNYAPQKDVFGMVEWYLDAADTNSIFGFTHDSDYWFDAGSIEKINSIEKFLSHME